MDALTDHERNAKRNMRNACVDFPLVHAGAEAAPLADASFDIIFCDHGAMTFCDPFRAVLLPPSKL
jgi:ubiquinone/menaquinone biosynthesis C-methylase UbiE